LRGFKIYTKLFIKKEMIRKYFSIGLKGHLTASKLHVTQFFFLRITIKITCGAPLFFFFFFFFFLTPFHLRCRENLCTKKNPLPVSVLLLYIFILTLLLHSDKASVSVCYELNKPLLPPSFYWRFLPFRIA
jgi:hypothetical protein